jgi:hypothetical protein
LAILSILNFELISNHVPEQPVTGTIRSRTSSYLYTASCAMEPRSNSSSLTGAQNHTRSIAAPSPEILPPSREVSGSKTSHETATAHPFIQSLRPICETIFDLLLCGYIASIDAYRNRSASRGTEQSKLRKSLDKWDGAVKSASEALTKFRFAETKRQNKDSAGANETVREALTVLKLR